MEPALRAPAGTVALLFTDIEGSTRLARELGTRWPEILADHHALVEAAIRGHGGYVERTEGDAFFAVFTDPAEAASAAVEAQRSLRDHRWPDAVGELRVRMGLHVGHVEHRDIGYTGLEIHRAARVAAAAHGGQLLLTAAAHALTADAVAAEPLGSFRLKDFPAPEPLFCAVVDGRGASAFPPPRTPETRPTNLPPAATPLVGRDPDMERLRAALLSDGDRLVTLTGRGGVGKTSLALAAAGDLLDEHPGGVWIVRLAEVTSSDELLAAVGRAVRAEDLPDRAALHAVVERLHDRGPVLLVLDNLEQLLEAAPEIGRLLDALPDLRILATSQVPLRTARERLLALDGLDDVAALALVDRTARRIGTATRGADRDALTDVVRLLDGLPLAVELAAARLAVLTPVQLRERLADSTAVLTARGGDRPERQRSLRATVDWTLDLLDAEPRALFTRMGAFAGPVALEDIEAVAGADGLDVLDALGTLADVALVRRVEGGEGGVRFGLPETLRQIAARELDAAPDGARWRRAHAERQLAVAWAARLGNMVTGAAWRAAAAAEGEAFAALRWARDAGEPVAAPLAAAMALRLCERGRVRDVMAALSPVLETPSGDPDVDAIALMGYAYALIMLDRTDDALAAANRAVTLARDQATAAFAHIGVGFLHLVRGDVERAIEESERATALAHAAGPSATAYASLMEAQARLTGGDLDRAAALLAEGELIGTPVDAKLLWNIDTLHGDLAMQRGRPRQALEHYSRSLMAAEARGDDLQVLFDLLGTANALAALGDDEPALEVAGLAEALNAEMVGDVTSYFAHLLGTDPAEASERRLGAEEARRCKALGLAQKSARRVARACELARG